MAKDKPLTRKELVRTLKEVGVATKADVRQILGEEIARRQLATRSDVRKIVGEEIDSRKLVSQDDLKNLASKNDLKKGLGGLERRLVIRMNKMERGLSQSIADLAETTPTRQEFEELKQRVSGKYGFV